MQLVWICLGALAATVVLHFSMTLALARRLRSLQLEVGRSTMRDPALPRPGDVVGGFAATTTAGDIVTNESFAEGASLVGIFTPGCPDCARVREQLLASPPALPFVALIDCTLAEDLAHDVAVALQPIAKVVLARRGDPALGAFRDAGFPTLIRVDHGVVTASGHRLADVLPDGAWFAPDVAA